MIRSPYQTTLLEHTNMGRVLKDLEAALIQRTLTEMVGYENTRDFDVYAVTDIDQHRNLDPFYQPILIDRDDGRPAIIYDARPYAKHIRVEDVGGGFPQGTIISINESLNLLQFSAVFMGIYLDRPNTIIHTSEVPMMVYGSLLTENLGRKFALDPTAQLNMMATFHIFYASRAYKSLAELDSVAEKTAMETMLSRKMRVKPEIYQAILAAMDVKQDLANLVTVCQFIKNQNWSPKLNTLSAKDLYALVMHSWIGQGNPKETMLVALEFPPVWVGLVYIVSRNNFYQKLPIGQIIKRIDRANNLKSFAQQLQQLTR